MTTRLRLLGRSLRRGALTTALAALCLVPASAQEASEASLKAAFLYNFVRFTEWPASDWPAGEPLDLCVTNGAVAQSLAPISGKLIDGHPIAIHRVDLSKGLNAAIAALIRKCEILYLDDIDGPTVREIVRQLKGDAVLTVGDRADFTKLGGIVRFYLERGRLRFEINQDAAQQEGLRLSAQLLQLARINKD